MQNFVKIGQLAVEISRFSILIWQLFSILDLLDAFWITYEEHLEDFIIMV